MRALPIACSLIAFAAGIAAMQGGGDEVVILSGDTQGYLSPCGCTSPMIGGIRRRATVIRSLNVPGRTTYLENGGMVLSAGRQDLMKAETLVQSLADLGVTAINVGPADARLGIGSILELSQLAPGKMISSSLAHPEAHYLGRTVQSGSFLIGGATDTPRGAATALGDTPVSLDDAVKSLVDAADEANLKPVLMLQGSHDSAVQLAHAFPKLALIEYSSLGSPPSASETIGDTVLATPGERGKYVIRLTFKDGRFGGYRAIALGPEYRDDPVVSRFYATYLKRVKDEKLLEKLPRKETPQFAGSWACSSCHSQAMHVWKASGHRIAFRALQDQHHDSDPDCVSCHVVGLASTRGFRSATLTPALAGVGCESCHGPAAAHAANPAKAKPARITPKACVGCHNPENSPNFEYEAYWRRISHH